MSAGRKLRNRITAATSAILVATCSALLWLFFAYFSSRPKAPHLHALDKIMSDFSWQKTLRKTAAHPGRSRGDRPSTAPGLGQTWPFALGPSAGRSVEAKDWAAYWRGGIGTGCDPVSRWQALEEANAKVAYRKNCSQSSTRFGNGTRRSVNGMGSNEPKMWVQSFRGAT